ncbi:MAG TPA: glycosyl hydrolase [Fimbriimonadaceae bacterium]|nr:glycosyl hydrolase [Fimbriimonadaceae bacterium]
MTTTTTAKQATFRCSLAGEAKPLPHFWEHTVGSGHAPLALRADWQAQLKRCHEELGFRHTRFHGLLCDEMGTLMCEKDKLLYSFFNSDQIWDFHLSIGMKPFVELSFMPSTLSSGGDTVFHYDANVTPPEDYGAWATLIRKLVGHWVERYGIEEVATWFFEVWNEPNLKAFWTGTQADYFHLYRVTAEAIKEVDSRLRVGGPATASNAWIPEFLDFCEENAVPVDFVSTHHYPTDALGTVGEDTESQLAQSERSILRKWAQESHRKARGKPLYYTEWNSSSNPRDPLHDEPYTAAVVVKTMMEARGLVQGYSFWTFTDIFEENYMPANAFQGGFGLLTLQGVAKPSYRAFELLHRLGDEELPVEGSHETVDVWMARDGHAVTALITNHALPRHPIEAESVEIVLSGITGLRHVYVERIDEEHANAKRLWIEMGRPPMPTPREVEQLGVASEIIREPTAWTLTDGVLRVELDVPAHAVVAVTVELEA